MIASRRKAESLHHDRLLRCPISWVSHVCSTNDYSNELTSLLFLLAEDSLTSVQDLGKNLILSTTVHNLE